MPATRATPLMIPALRVLCVWTSSRTLQRAITASRGGDWMVLPAWIEGHSLALPLVLANVSDGSTEEAGRCTATLKLDPVTEPSTLCDLATRLRGISRFCAAAALSRGIIQIIAHGQHSFVGPFTVPFYKGGLLPRSLSLCDPAYLAKKWNSPESRSVRPE